MGIWVVYAHYCPLLAPPDAVDGLDAGVLAVEGGVLAPDPVLRHHHSLHPHRRVGRGRVQRWHSHRSVRGRERGCYFVLQSPVKSCASVKVSTGSRHMVLWCTPGAGPVSTVSASREIPSRQSVPGGGSEDARRVAGRHGGTSSSLPTLRQNAACFHRFMGIFRGCFSPIYQDFLKWSLHQFRMIMTLLGQLNILWFVETRYICMFTNTQAHIIYLLSTDSFVHNNYQ